MGIGPQGGNGMPLISVPPPHPAEFSAAGWTGVDRLRVLGTYDILDTPREPAFNDIVQLAADILDAPVAFISLIAEGRHWFKAEIGLGLDGTPLNTAICTEVMHQRGVFVVPDTTGDDRFARNPLVTDRPHLRFCAGAVLETAEGVPLGTLCVMDADPRPDGISERQRRSLAALAGQVMTQLELRRVLARNQAHRDLLDQAQRAAGMGVWQWNVGTQDLIWSAELCRVVGRDPATFEVTLDNAVACLHPDDRQATLEWLHGAAQDGVCYDHECRFVRPDGEVRHCWVNRSRVRGKQDAIITVGGLVQDITEAKQAEQALRESEGRLRTVFSHARIGILLRDLDHRVLMVNDCFCEFVGCTPDDLIGLTVDAFTYPEDAALNRPLYDVHQKTGEPFRVEKRFLRTDGTAVWCAMHVSFVRDEQGEVVSTIAIAEDITARREAEEELRDSKELLQTVIDSVADLIFVKDREGRFAFANRAAVEGLGILPGVRDEDFLTKARAQGYLANDQQVMAAGEPLAVDEYIPINGDERIFQTVKVPWRRHGEIMGVIGVARDVTERKQAEQALRESVEHYRYSVELSPQIPWTAAADGKIEEIGPRWEVLVGMLVADACGEGWVAALHPEDVPATMAIWGDALKTGDPVDVEYRLCLRDGGFRWFRARAAARRDENGSIVRWYGTLEDIHEQKLANTALRESEERLQLAVKVTGMGVWDYDARTQQRRWSPGLRAILGLTEGEPAEGESFLRLVHPDDRAGMVALLIDARDPAMGREFESVFRIQRANDGAWRWIAAAGRKLFDDSGVLSRVISSMRDVTEQHTAEENIRWAATHDPLTQLPNRFLFQEHLDQALHASLRDPRKLGLLLLDVDQFKQVNDTFGHGAGDALLKLFGERLRSVLRSGDMVARLGGDEFGVLLQNIGGPQDIRAIVATILERLREPFAYDGRIVDCRASIGAALYPDHAGNIPDLLKHADIALYLAKAGSRGGLMVFDASMHAAMERRFSMHHLARRAIDAGKIEPFYQPKVDLKSGRITGFEALLRLRNGRGGVQLPSSIAAAFDDINLATAIGSDMLENVVADMQRWLGQGLDFGHVALNASAAEFRHDDLAERILEKLQAAGVPTSCLELEVTETVFLGRGAEYVERALKTLSREGVRIALDDFGTGYASLLHLKQFPVDIIKIDRSFVRDLETDGSDAAIVRAVLHLGQSLGIKIVAEGIETPVQAAHLWAQGCDYGQGFFFGKPTPAGRIPGLIAGWVPTDEWKTADGPRMVRPPEPIGRRFDAVS